MNSTVGRGLGSDGPIQQVQSLSDPADSRSSRETEMISRILAGERELFYELIKPYQRSLFMISFSVLRNEADAEETSQDAFLKAYRALASFRGSSKFSTWLSSIALNEARMKLRRLRPGVLVSLEDLTNDDDEGDFTPAVLRDWREIPSEALDRKELREMLQTTLNELPQKYREVLILRDVREMNIAETAEVLGVSHGVVKTRLLRARLMMQKLLAPRLHAQSKRLTYGA